MTALVRFESVSKRYPRGGPRYPSLRHELTARAVRVFRRRGDTRERGRAALHEVSFAVDEGESFAIIGPNGAGKTTAVKLAARITHPTAGRVRVRGRVGALIEVGSGIHPELTARENILLYGQILGMTKSDVRARFDEIVEFSELGASLDVPVKMYSSGMQLRLGFSIAAHLDPDVFVVDEALAVGDAGFQAKCVERMTKLVAEGRSLIFVSHNLFAVEALCQRGIFLLDGRVQHEGSAQDVVRGYLGWVDDRRAAANAEPQAYRSAPGVRLVAVSCHGADGDERYAFHTGEDVEVRLQFDLPQPLHRPVVSLGISDGRPGALALASMQVDGNIPDLLDGKAMVGCRLRNLPLLPGVYEILGSVVSEHGWGEVVDWQPLVKFRVVEPPDSRWGGRAAASHLAFAPVRVDYDWTWQSGGG